MNIYFVVRFMNKSYNCIMKLCVVLVSICALGLGRNNNIINGPEVKIEHFPYQITLQYRGKHYCGGAILNHNTILTAAHCVYGMNLSFYTIRAGSKFVTQGEVFKISSFNPHPDYNTISSRFKFANDIAVIKLARPLKFSAKIQPIKLQPKHTPVPVGTTATVSGFGVTSNNVPSVVLRAVKMNVVSFAECKSKYKKLTEITNNNICLLTPNKGACSGDSGGPLVANGRLIGTVIGGVNCAGSYYPNVFSNVSNLRYFIDQYL